MISSSVAVPMLACILPANLLYALATHNIDCQSSALSGSSNKASQLWLDSCVVPKVLCYRCIAYSACSIRGVSYFRHYTALEVKCRYRVQIALIPLKGSDSSGSGILRAKHVSGEKSGCMVCNGPDWMLYSPKCFLAYQRDRKYTQRTLNHWNIVID
jgi:hypothetical protein